MKHWLLTAALVLSGCDDSESPQAKPTPAGCIPDKAWTIGPVIKGENYSKGSPLNPCKVGGGMSFAIGPTAEPHYITRETASLVGKSQIRMRYKVEGSASIYGAPGKENRCTKDMPSAVTLYIQREDDDWQRNGWRWWHQATRTKLAGPGEYEITAPLDGAGWSSVQGMTADASPTNWKATMRDPHVIGFTFGNCEGSGHGARATGPIKFTVTEFAVL